MGRRNSTAANVNSNHFAGELRVARLISSKTKTFLLRNSQFDEMFFAATKPELAAERSGISLEDCRVLHAYAQHGKHVRVDGFDAHLQVIFPDLDDDKVLSILSILEQERVFQRFTGLLREFPDIGKRVLLLWGFFKASE